MRHKGTDMALSATDDIGRPERRAQSGALAGRIAGLRRGLTLRFALLSLMSVFGLGLVTVVGWNGAQQFHVLQAYRLERDIDLTRRSIRSAFIEVETAARRLGYVPLDPGYEGEAQAALATAIEQMQVAATLFRAKAEADRAADIDGLIAQALGIADGLDGTAVQDGAARTLIGRELVALAETLAQLRRDTVGMLHIADVQMALLHLVRNQAIAQHRDLDIATDIVTALLLDPASTPQSALGALDAALIRLQAPPLGVLSDDAIIAIPDRAVLALSDSIRDGVVPSLEAVAAARLAGEVPPGLVSRWIDEVEHADGQVRLILAETDRAAIAHIDARIDRARRDAVVATIGGAAVLLAFVMSIVMVTRRLILPMARLRHTLMRLAEGDLRPIEAPYSPFSDVQAVIDALRVFRMDAIRRDRLRRERLELMAELTAANREMRADLEAAAALQVAQLPLPGPLGVFRFDCHFRASRHLGGDSFDYFRLPDGRIAVFQLDVAGHGTASSLVAVAAHTAIKRGLMEMGEGRSVVDVMAEVNANWKPDLPYFTAIVMTFASDGSGGSMVQAGHPYPLCLPAHGPARRLGQGALPVGVHDEPAFEARPVALDPGDRLFVFSDGIYEVRNPAGEIYGEDRLCALVERLRHHATQTLVERIMSDLKTWAATPDLDDDISLIVMERP